MKSFELMLYNNSPPADCQNSRVFKGLVFENYGIIWIIKKGFTGMVDSTKGQLKIRSTTEGH